MGASRDLGWMSGCVSSRPLGVCVALTAVVLAVGGPSDGARAGVQGVSNDKLQTLNADVLDAETLELELSLGFYTFDSELGSDRRSRSSGGRGNDTELALRASFGVGDVAEIGALVPLSYSVFDADDDEDDEQDTAISEIFLGAKVKLYELELAPATAEAREEYQVEEEGSAATYRLVLGLQAGGSASTEADVDYPALLEFGTIFSLFLGDAVSVDADFSYLLGIGAERDEVENGLAANVGLGIYIDDRLQPVIELNWSWEQTREDEVSWQLLLTLGVVYEFADEVYLSFGVQPTLTGRNVEKSYGGFFSITIGI